MTTTTKPKAPRIVDLLGSLVQELAALRAELRLSTEVKVLSLGVSVLQHDVGARATTERAKARVAARNALRDRVRVQLGLEANE